MDTRTDLVVMGTQTVKSITAAGFVKNSAAGLLSSNTFSKACARCTTAQSLPAAATTLVNLNQTDWDTDSIVDLSNDRIKPTKAGYYLVTGYVNVHVPMNRAWMFAAIYRNYSPTWVAQGEIMVNWSTTLDMTYGSRVCDLIYMNGSTDYLELRAYVSTAAHITSDWYAQSNFIDVIGPF